MSNNHEVSLVRPRIYTAAFLAIGLGLVTILLLLAKQSGGIIAAELLIVAVTLASTFFLIRRRIAANQQSLLLEYRRPLSRVQRYDWKQLRSVSWSEWGRGNPTQVVLRFESEDAVSVSFAWYRRRDVTRFIELVRSVQPGQKRRL